MLPGKRVQKLQHADARYTDGNRLHHINVHQLGLRKGEPGQKAFQAEVDKQQDEQNEHHRDNQRHGRQIGRLRDNFGVFHPQTHQGNQQNADNKRAKGNAFAPNRVVRGRGRNVGRRCQARQSFQNGKVASPLFATSQGISCAGKPGGNRQDFPGFSGWNRIAFQRAESNPVTTN